MGFPGLALCFRIFVVLVVGFDLRLCSLGLVLAVCGFGHVYYFSCFWWKLFWFGIFPDVRRNCCQFWILDGLVCVFWVLDIWCIWSWLIECSGFGVCYFVIYKCLIVWVVLLWIALVVVVGLVWDSVLSILEFGWVFLVWCCISAFWLLWYFGVVCGCLVWFGCFNVWLLLLMVRWFLLTMMFAVFGLMWDVFLVIWDFGFSWLGFVEFVCLVFWYFFGLGLGFLAWWFGFGDLVFGVCSICVSVCCLWCYSVVGLGL